MNSSRSSGGKKVKTDRRGYFRQIPIYLGKFFRMFVYMDDWKMVPMAALIAGLVSFAVGKDLFVSMEGTLKGSLALTCVCIWNGFFNSIQSVCRERQIVKREHRAGMKITSYITAHMIYQAFLCLMQALITLAVCRITKIHMPSSGLITPFFYVDITIAFFLITFSADMTSLLISCMARNTTAAMTVMPFILIFELLFSGGVFALTPTTEVISYFTIAKWGMCAICALGGYNSLPMTSIWKQISKLQDYEYEGMQPVRLLVETMERENRVDEFCLKTAASNFNPDYVSTSSNLAGCWLILLIFVLVFALLSMLALTGIDSDRR